MINILLSTFQSERYLVQLIDSILNQSYKEWKLIVRDDGSTDNTNLILYNYQNDYPEKIIVLADIAGNIGTVKSFEHLLAYSSEADYIMFCDHDDIWLSDKIKISIEKMGEMEKANPHCPILVHTDLTVVDMKGEVIHSSFWNLSKLDPQLLTNFNYLAVCNGVTGCTIIINKKSREVCLPISENARMHDSWIALCVSKYGKIGYISEPTILYRQHLSNQIGAKEGRSLFRYIQSKLQNLKKTIRYNKMQLAMVRDLKHTNLFKYFIFKLIYFLKTRI
jgi:glycosyltransferase involved in cell wall biosynthesis